MTRFRAPIGADLTPSVRENGSGGRSDEGGTASVVAVAILGGLVVLSLGFAGVGRALSAHVQLTAAADAAALAAAPLTFLGGDPVAEARTYASANGGRLLSCECRMDPRPVPRTVTVSIGAPVELPIFGRLELRVRAAAEFDPAALWGG